MAVLAKKPYYECHITFKAVIPSLAESFVEMLKWKFSMISGDPIQGAGTRCYATRHFRASRAIGDVLKDLNKAADQLHGIVGIRVTRRKIEMVLHDHITR